MFAGSRTCGFALLPPIPGSVWRAAKLAGRLPPTTPTAVVRVQERAKEATGALREIGRHGIALARMTQEPVARELLRHRADDDALARFARIRELLDHLEDAIRQSADRVQVFRVDLARLRGGAIA